MKRLSLAILAALTLSAAPAFAEPAAAPVDPAAAAAVNDLLMSMHYRELMLSAFKQVSKNVPQMILQTATAGVNANTSLTPEQRKAEMDKVAQHIPDAVKAVDTIFADPKLVDDMIKEIVPLYARYFTVAEIQQIAAFYKTPVGTKMLNTMPQLMGESMQISQRVMAPRVQKIIEQFAKMDQAKKQ